MDCVDKLEMASLSVVDRAVKLFNFMREEIPYKFTLKLTEDEYIASTVLACGGGFCVQKAVLLCALGRAAGIPTALVLSDMRDHSLSPNITAALGTDVMYHHGLNAFYLAGQWLKVDISLTKNLILKKGYKCVEFDGRSDALLPATLPDGNPHSEYLVFHGIYPDLPFEQMFNAFLSAYNNADPQALSALGIS